MHGSWDHLVIVYANQNILPRCQCTGTRMCLEPRHRQQARLHRQQALAEFHGKQYHGAAAQTHHALQRAIQIVLELVMNLNKVSLAIAGTARMQSNRTVFCVLFRRRCIVCT